MSFVRDTKRSIPGEWCSWQAEKGVPGQANSALGPGIVSVYPNHRVAEVKSAAWITLFNW
jgi:hypothetical protein